MARAKTSRSSGRAWQDASSRRPTDAPAPMKLRLYHHHDGARVAYREAGTGRPLALLHSRLLSHREWEPVVEELSHRYRLVLPDLPLHGDSEDRPRHPYTPDWLAEVMAGFIRETCGPRPLVGGHDAGAQILLHAIATRQLTPGKLVLMPNADAPPARARRRASACSRRAVRAAAVPGLDRAISHGARLAFRPGVGRAADRARQPGRARPRPPRLRRPRRQRQPRALMGARRAALAEGRPARPARGLRPDRGADAAAVGRRGPAAPALASPRRRSTCCPTRSCACSRGPAS